MTKTKIFLSTFLSSVVLLSSCYAVSNNEETTGFSRLGVHLTREKDTCSEWTVANIQFTSRCFLSNLEHALKTPSINRVHIHSIPKNSLPNNEDVWLYTGIDPVITDWKAMIVRLEDERKAYSFSFSKT